MNKKKITFKGDSGAACESKNFVLDFPLKIFLIGTYTKQGFLFGKEYAKIKCKEIYELYYSEIRSYIDQLTPKEKEYSGVLIVNRSDEIGTEIAKKYFNPDELFSTRKRLHTLIERNELINLVLTYDIQVAVKLKRMKELPIVVLDFGVVGVLPA